MLRSIPLRAPVCVPSMWICPRPAPTNMAESRADAAHLGEVGQKIQTQLPTRQTQIANLFANLAPRRLLAENTGVAKIT